MPTFNKITVSNKFSKKLEDIKNTLLGIDQQWVDVTSSRSASTDYVNDTGKPIMVAVTKGSTSGASALRAVVDGIQICDISSESRTGFSFIVPDGQTYRVNFTGGASPVRWAELR